MVVIDADKLTIDVELSAAEWERRRKEWKPPAPTYKKGLLAKYVKLVRNASDGATTS